MPHPARFHRGCAFPCLPSLAAPVLRPHWGVNSKRFAVRSGCGASPVQALNHSSLKFNSFALWRPFCGPMNLTSVGAGAAGVGAGGGPARVAKARPVGMCCVMGCAVFNRGRRHTSERRAVRHDTRPSGGVLALLSGRHGRFATGSGTLAERSGGRRLWSGMGRGFASIVTPAWVNSGMVDSGAAMAGAAASAQWGRIAGSGALLNRGGE
jgi:hypothetical protein